MTMMPEFKFKLPNIRSIPGEEWVSRHRVYVDLPKDSDEWKRPLGSWQEGCLYDGKPATSWKMPSGPGEGFYHYLHKHHTLRDGEYR